jgi:hypothetical protein
VTNRFESREVKESRVAAEEIKRIAYFKAAAEAKFLKIQMAIGLREQCMREGG